MNIQTKRRQTGGKTVEKSLFYLNVHFLREKVILGKGVGWAFKIMRNMQFSEKKMRKSLTPFITRSTHSTIP